MTERQADGLRRLAALRERSQAALLREALDDLLATEQRLHRIALARRAIGAFSSGGAETARRHDEALDEAFGS